MLGQLCLLSGKYISTDEKVFSIAFIVFCPVPKFCPHQLQNWGQLLNALSWSSFIMPHPVALGLSFCGLDRRTPPPFMRRHGYWAPILILGWRLGGWVDYMCAFECCFTIDDQNWTPFFFFQKDWGVGVFLYII